MSISLNSFEINVNFIEIRHLWIAVDNAGGVITAHYDCPNRHGIG